MSGSNSVVATNGAEPVEGAPRPRVLMVDDQPDNLMALAALEPLDAEPAPGGGTSIVFTLPSSGLTGSGDG